MPIPRQPFVSAYDRAAALDEGQHRRVLADATPHVPNDAFALLARSVSLQTKPVTRLAAMLNAMPVRELRDAMANYPLFDGLKGAKKGELVAFLSAIITSPNNDYGAFVSNLGTDFLTGFRRLVEAGGRIDIPQEQLTQPDQLIEPCFPLVQLYCWQGTFTYVLPEELRARFDDSDWDALAVQAKAMDDALDYIDRAVELWGVVHIDDVVDDAVAYGGGVVFADEVMSAIMQGAGGRASGFEMVTLDDPLLVHQSLAWYLHEDELDYELGESELDALLEDREMYVPRPLTRQMVQAGSLSAWLAQEDVAQELLAFLDGHVSSGLGDDAFADVLLSAIVRDAHDPAGTSSLFSLLKELDITISEQQLDYVIGLHAALAAHVPLWSAYGWSRIELETGKASATEHADHEEDATQMADVVPFSPQKTGATDEPEASDKRDANVVSFSTGLQEDDDEDDYEAVERRCKELEDKNEGYLSEFEEWLTASGLKPKTVGKHLDNVAFFLNHYLHYYEAIPMQDGPQYIDDFLGDWFVRKAMWSTSATIQQTAASLKKFYQCMLEYGHVGTEDLAMVLNTVKENLQSWKDACEDFNAGGGDPFWF